MRPCLCLLSVKTWISLEEGRPTTQPCCLLVLTFRLSLHEAHGCCKLLMKLPSGEGNVSYFSFRCKHHTLNRGWETGSNFIVSPVPEMTWLHLCRCFLSWRPLRVVWMEICSFIQYLRTRNRTRNNRSMIRTSLLLIFQCKIKLITSQALGLCVVGPFGNPTRRPSVLLHSTGTGVYIPVISLYVLSVLVKVVTGLFCPM